MTAESDELWCLIELDNEQLQPKWTKISQKHADQSTHSLPPPQKKSKMVYTIKETTPYAYINKYICISLSLSQSFQFFHCLRNCYYMLDHFVHHIQSSSTKICFGCAAHENCPRRPPGTAQENRPMIERLPLVLWQCVRA
jgi:hypothetical protein